MRGKILGGLSALLMAGVSTAALAEVQYNFNNVTTQTTVDHVTVNTPLTATTSSVGNIISANVGGAYVSNDNQATDNHLNTAIGATATLTEITSTGGATVTTEALGNVEQLKAAGNSFLANGGAGGPLQGTGGQPINAVTNIAHSVFDGLTAQSNATGNSISTQSTYGSVALGDSTLAYYGDGTQVNLSKETSALTIDDTDAHGVLLGGAQSVGNVATVGVSGAGVVAPNFDVNQANNAGQTAMATLTDANLFTTGNKLGSNAIGNAASFGVATTGQIQQTNTVQQSALTTVSNGLLNGAFSAQAVGDTLSFAGDTAGVLINQNSSGPGQSAVLNASGPLDLNAATSFSGLAVSNDFTGTVVPGQAPGTFYQQQASGVGPSSNVTVSGVGSSVGLTNVSSQAVGNLASLTAPGAFMQSMTAPSFAASSISASTFNAGLSVSTGAIGNSINVH
jgi:hypothetical protein